MLLGYRLREVRTTVQMGCLQLGHSAALLIPTPFKRVCSSSKALSRSKRVLSPSRVRQLDTDMLITDNQVADSFCSIMSTTVSLTADDVFATLLVSLKLHIYMCDPE
jgi:hypothetical protein